MNSFGTAGAPQSSSGPAAQHREAAVSAQHGEAAALAQPSEAGPGCDRRPMAVDAATRLHTFPPPVAQLTHDAALGMTQHVGTYPPAYKARSLCLTPHSD